MRKFLPRTVLEEKFFAVVRVVHSRHAQGILHPKDKKPANNQQNNAPSPLTETKGISKTFMTIRDCKYVILSYMPTILKCVGNLSPNVLLSNQAYSFIRK